MARLVEKAGSQWGLPNAGAFVGGLRYGDGTSF
jgi:hypothetical protein